MQLERIRADGQDIAVRKRGDGGHPILLVHGNSCSSRSFEKQLASSLAHRFRLVAMDLPGHGDSSRAEVPERTYTIPGHAAAVAAAATALGMQDAVFVGWSLGGHVLLEAAERLPHAAGFLIFGAPPVASNADVPKALTTNPAIGAAFREDSSDDEVQALVTLFFRPGAELPRLFFEDFHRTDKRARAALGASVARNDFRDEVRVVAELRQPLAVLHGAHELVANRAWIDSLRIPTLWRGAVQEVPGAGHAPHWESAEAFNQLLAEFVTDCGKAT